MQFEKGDLLFMTKSSDVMLEHFVLVDDITEDGEIVATKVMTLIKESQAYQIPGFGINGNEAFMQGADRSKMYIKLEHFDVYGKVLSTKIIEAFNSFILAMEQQTLQEPKKVILA